MKQQIADYLSSALKQLCDRGDLPAAVLEEEIRVSVSRQPALGDFSCNLAMRLAKSLGRPPREIAQLVLDELPANQLIREFNIAGAGFMNFFVNRDASLSVIARILEQGSHYGKAAASGQSYQVEFVSANPTGPLHVGHGRGAAYGDCIARLLETAGHRVEREYYVNDAGRQMDILALSIWLRYLALCGQELFLPGKSYQGDYINRYATELRSRFVDALLLPVDQLRLDLPAETDQNGDQLLDLLISRMKLSLGADLYQEICHTGRDGILADIKSELCDFGIDFDRWFFESSLSDSAASEIIERLGNSGHTEERDGALWFLSSRFGDRKDRVLRRSNGQLTYFATDIAYHWNKLERGFDRVIDVWGADHHGYIERIKAALKALEIDPNRLEIRLVQLVSLRRGDRQIQMSTRKGEFVTLKELRDKVGDDAARFFYIFRRADQPTDFDIELAVAKNRDNPVYNLQYAHARLSGVLRQLREQDLSWERQIGLQALHLLDDKEVSELLMLLSSYPDTVRQAAASYAPWQVVNLLRELASSFHFWYDSYRILIDAPELRNARLCLAMAVREVLRNGLGILGINAPETM